MINTVIPDLIEIENSKSGNVYRAFFLFEFLNNAELKKLR